jgi:hypothetical protein
LKHGETPKTKKTKKKVKEKETPCKEEGNEGLPSFKKHFDEKMRMPFLIAHSFQLEIEITKKRNNVENCKSKS